jgi:hypothetical protein
MDEEKVEKGNCSTHRTVRRSGKIVASSMGAGAISFYGFSGFFLNIFSSILFKKEKGKNVEKR